MFGFVKKCFFTGLAFLSSLTSVNVLSCISMNNQECKTRPQLLMLMEMSLCFFYLVLKQVNVAVVVIILIIRIQKLVLMML